MTETPASEKGGGTCDRSFVFVHVITRDPLPQQKYWSQCPKLQSTLNLDSRTIWTVQVSLGKLENSVLSQNHPITVSHPRVFTVTVVVGKGKSLRGLLTLRERGRDEIKREIVLDDKTIKRLN